MHVALPANVQSAKYQQKWRLRYAPAVAALHQPRRCLLPVAIVFSFYSLCFCCYCCECYRRRLCSLPLANLRLLKYAFSIKRNFVATQHILRHLHYSVRCVFTQLCCAALSWGVGSACGDCAKVAGKRRLRFQKFLFTKVANKRAAAFWLFYICLWLLLLQQLLCSIIANYAFFGVHTMV